ncbi:MAG: adenylate kinase [Candidatus Woesearchaeota archaeon]|nr:adenylate kinase [Candidatus Woesearchaeota archaeon]
MKKKIIILGSPGVGKGTYTRLLSKEFGLPHISTGDMFREHLKKKTELGKKAKKIVNEGGLVPDEIVSEMVKHRLAQEDCNNGWLLDGYPRNINQAETLQSFTKVDSVLRFVADKKVIIDRLSGRRVCKKCGATYHVRNVPPKSEGICDKCGGDIYQRKDDKPEFIKTRLKIYKKQTAPLISFYQKRDLITDVNVNSEYEKRYEVLEWIKEKFKD